MPKAEQVLLRVLILVMRVVLHPDCRSESLEVLFKNTDALASQLEILIHLVRGMALALLLLKKSSPSPLTDDFNLQPGSKNPGT